MSEPPEDTTAKMRSLNRLANERRSQFLDSLRVSVDHARPTRLKARAGNKILDGILGAIAHGRTAITEYPARALGIVALTGAVIARKPLLKLSTQALKDGKASAIRQYRLYRNAKKEKNRENEIAEDSVNPEKHSRENETSAAVESSTDQQ